MSSAICFSLNQSKILSSGNGLNACNTEQGIVTDPYIPFCLTRTDPHIPFCLTRTDPHIPFCLTRTDPYVPFCVT